MNARTTTRIIATGLLAAAAVAAAPTAQAAQSSHPDPSTVRPVQANLRETVLQLLDQGRQATTVAERRLIHRELIQAVLDGE